MIMLNFGIEGWLRKFFPMRFFHEYWQPISTKIVQKPSEQLILVLLSFDLGLILTFLLAFYLNLAGEQSLVPLSELPIWPLKFTVFNGTFILLSIFCLVRAFLAIFSSDKRIEILKWLSGCFWSGVAFTLLQGAEWFQLLSFGLNEPLNLLAVFFDLLIFAYALHLLAGLIALAMVKRKLSLNNWLLQPFSHVRVILGQTHLALVGAYWGTILLSWPLVYYLVYLK
jgi:heme/copper-type cytochrome/quinol oxidase subunit 3